MDLVVKFLKDWKRSRWNLIWSGSVEFSFETVVNFLLRERDEKFSRLWQIRLNLNSPQSLWSNENWVQVSHFFATYKLSTNSRAKHSLGPLPPFLYLHQTLPPSTPTQTFTVDERSKNATIKCSLHFHIARIYAKLLFAHKFCFYWMWKYAILYESCSAAKMLRGNY